MEGDNEKIVSEEEQVQENNKKVFFRKYLIVIILIAMIILMTVLNENFLTVDNILNLLTQTAIYGILAFGAQLAITTGGIDVSTGSTLALAGIVSGVFSQMPDTVGKIFPNMPMIPILLTILIAVGVGAVVGSINGRLISKYTLPPFIATLGAQISVRGLALFISGGRPVSNINPQVNIFSERIWGWLPVPVLVFGLVAIFMGVLMNYTSLGKSIYAIGGNKEAAELSGINVNRNLTIAYMLAGAFAGIAALIYMGRTGGSIQPSAAVGYETTAIAATTIGGTSHNGGISTVWGTVVGALILGVMTNGFTLLGVDAYIQQIIQGVIIVGAVLIDVYEKDQ